MMATKISRNLVTGQGKTAMDFLKIKNLVKQNGDKFIFVENGEPEMVMMSFGEYQKLSQRDTNTRMHANDTNKDHYYAGFADLEQRGTEETEFMTPIAVESMGLPVRLEDIRLEDLPI